MRHSKNIVLLIETTRSYGRGLCRGIAAYAHQKPRWILHHHARRLNETLPTWIRRLGTVDGILARIATPKLGEALGTLGVPVVDLLGQFSLPGIVRYDTDPSTLAQMAWEHFFRNGFRQFAFCGYPGVYFSDQREQAFVDVLAANNTPCAIFTGSKTSEDILKRELSGDTEIAALREWLETLPHRTAILCCNDERARQLLQAAAELGLRVPEEFAILGVDNDEVLCDLAQTPLSSIQPNTHRIGYEGADMLHYLMEGKLQITEMPTVSLRIPPEGVVERASTNLATTGDELVDRAIQLIRDQACNRLSVEQILGLLNVSRATLERRFRSYLARTPAEEILRVRLDTAKHLLGTSEQTIPQIALTCGFKTPSHFSRRFREAFAIPPGQYRQSVLGTR